MRFTLQPEDKAELEKLVKSGMTPVVISQRAQILLNKAENKSSTVIAGEIGVNRHTVELWCKKYRNRSADQTILDVLSVSEGRGRKAEITGNVIKLSKICQRLLVINQPRIGMIWRFC